MKKEQKNKVGRPKLADKKLKKKSYIILGISALLLVILISGTLASLNLIPSTKKLKGSTVYCTSIPDHLAYNEQTNPNGFKDLNFYKNVVYAYGKQQTNNYYYNSTEYCDTITEEQLSTITDLNAPKEGIISANGVQYLTGLKDFYLNNNQLTSIDLSHNTALEDLNLNNNQLTSIDLSHNSNLRNVWLEYNNLSNIDLTNVTESYVSLYDNNFNKSIYIMESEEKISSIIFPESYEPTYSIEDKNIINIENDKITGLKAGTTNYILSARVGTYKTPFSAEINVTVIGIKSNKCNVNNINNVVECNDKEKITESDFEVTPVGEVEIEENILKVKVEDEVIGEYELINTYKEPEKTEENNPTNNSSSDNKVDTKVVTTTKKENTTKKNSNNKKTTTAITTTKAEEKKEETTTTSTTTVGNINKVVKKEEVKTNNPIIPIGLGIACVGAIAGIGYGIYLLKIKH